MTQPAYSQGVPIIGCQWPWTAAGPAAAWEIDLINAKISLVLYTFKGAHKMDPEFGSTLLALVFNNMGTALGVAASLEVRAVMDRYLPEVRVLDVRVTDARSGKEPDGLVTVDIDYEWLGRRGDWSGSVNPGTALGTGL